MWFFVLLRLSSTLPDPVLIPVPVPILVPVPISATDVVSVPAPVPVPILCSPTGSHPRTRSRSRPRSYLAFLRSSPPPFSFPPRPHHRSRPRSRLCSRPRPRSLLSVPLTRLPPWYDARVQTPGLANGVIGCSKAPRPVYRYGDACGIKVLVVKQERIAFEDVLLPSPPPDDGTRWSVSPTFVCVCVCVRVFPHFAGLTYARTYYFCASRDMLPSPRGNSAFLFFHSERPPTLLGTLQVAVFQSFRSRKSIECIYIYIYTVLLSLRAYPAPSPPPPP